MLKNQEGKLGAGNTGASSVSQLARRLLWNQILAGKSRPLPVVVLLGPAGAGKTWALNAISQECGSSVVHALPYDFGMPESNIPEESATTTVLAALAADFSRSWPARPDARFYRFTLGWIAAHQQINGISRGQGKDELRQSIEKLTQKSDAKISSAVTLLVDSAVQAGLAPGPAAPALKTVIPSLIRSLRRRPLRRAMRWHSRRPAAEGAPDIDALYTLNRHASRGHQEAVTEWLIDAFLEDVRDNYERMTRPDPKGSCGCKVPGNGPHWHNWVVLLDNVDRLAGVRFISDLLAARKRKPHDAHDPLLVIATSGRWDRAWQPEWRPIWKSEPAVSDGSRTVASCQKATYDHWLGKQSEDPTSGYYPVLLDPLTTDETARMLGIDRYAPECELGFRATRGLPGAVEEIRPLLGGREIEPGRRDALAASHAQDFSVSPWHERLGKLRLLDHIPNFTIDDVVAAAPFATAPWLVPHDASSLISHSQVGRILTELRTALWVSVPRDNAELHPWLASNLNLALARSEPVPNRPSYEVQFKALLGDQEAGEEAERRAYCQLALADISNVVDLLVTIFDKVPHREWVRQVMLITRAPDNLEIGSTSDVLYAELVGTDNDRRPGPEPVIRNSIIRLVAARWLQANPFTMPDPELRATIKDCCASLRALSRRPDVGDLNLDI